MATILERKRLASSPLAFECFTHCFLSQELSSRLDNATQEKNDLLNKVSSLEESVSSADSEKKIWEDKMNALTKGKAEIENKLASVTESLEAEKQVCYILNLNDSSASACSFSGRKKGERELIRIEEYLFFKIAHQLSSTWTN